MADDQLLDVLKETDLRVGFSDAFHSVASREMLDRTTLQPRLLRCLYGLGTNAGLKRVVAGDLFLNYHDLLYIRRRYLHKNALREAIGHIANATFAIRRPEIWERAPRRVPQMPKVRRVGSESHDRMAHPLWWQRGDDLLACKKKIDLYLLPT